MGPLTMGVGISLTLLPVWRTLFPYWVALSSLDMRGFALSYSILFCCCLLEAGSFLEGNGGGIGLEEGRVGRSREGWKEGKLWLRYIA